jgi:hypothetical protein
MNQNQIKSKPEDAEQPSPEGLSSSALLALEGAYDRFKACENRAVWGGSYEVESAAAQDLRGLGREMFAALEAFMKVHKANEKLCNSPGSGASPKPETL